MKNRSRPANRAAVSIARMIDLGDEGRIFLTRMENSIGERSVCLEIHRDDVRHVLLTDAQLHALEVAVSACADEGPAGKEIAP
jgi:hypothetical protein